MYVLIILNHMVILLILNVFIAVQMDIFLIIQQIYVYFNVLVWQALFQLIIMEIRSMEDVFFGVHKELMLKIHLDCVLLNVLLINMLTIIQEGVLLYVLLYKILLLIVQQIDVSEFVLKVIGHKILLKHVWLIAGHIHLDLYLV